MKPAFYIVIGIVIGLGLGAIGIFGLGINPKLLVPAKATQQITTPVATATEVTWIAIGKTGYNKDLTQHGVVYQKGDLYKICVEGVKGEKHCSNVYGKITNYHWVDVRYLAYTTETSTCQIDKWSFLNEQCQAKLGTPVPTWTPQSLP